MDTEDTSFATLDEGLELSCLIKKIGDLIEAKNKNY